MVEGVEINNLGFRRLLCIGDVPTLRHMLTL
jgi:hypothetical protein